VPAVARAGRVPTFMRTATTDATTARAPSSIRRGRSPSRINGIRDDRTTGLARKNSGRLGKTRARPASADTEAATRNCTGADPVPQPAQMFWLAVRADG